MSGSSGLELQERKYQSWSRLSFLSLMLAPGLDVLVRRMSLLGLVPDDA
jgi:hypothetical protein